jgi:hypothetical protein
MEFKKEFSEGTKHSIHRFKRLSQKVSIKVHRLLDPLDKAETRSGEAERDAAFIFRKMIKCQESELLMSPISQKQYVRNDEKRILLILDNYELTVINHVFSYNIRISQRTIKSLNEAFNIEIEKRRLEMEVSFKENVKHSLKTILVKIDE